MGLRRSGHRRDRVRDRRAATLNDVYTHGHDDAVLRSHRARTAANSAAYLLPSLEPGMSLLDVGCGPGTITADLARLVAPGRVVGVDVSAAVIDEARAAGPLVELVAGDFRELDLGRFDVVHAHQVLQHLRDPVGALRAMAARADRFVAARDSDYTAFAWYPADPRLERWRDIYLAVTERNGADAAAGTRLLAWARAAALVDVTYTSSTWTWATPAERAWWGDLWAERTAGAASSLAQQAVAYGVAARDELAAIAAGWREWAAHDDAVFIVTHGEILARV